MDNGINTIAVWGDSILKGAVTGFDDHRFEILKEEKLQSYLTRYKK